MYNVDAQTRLFKYTAMTCVPGLLNHRCKRCEKLLDTIRYTDPHCFHVYLCEIPGMSERTAVTIIYQFHIFNDKTKTYKEIRKKVLYIEHYFFYMLYIYIYICPHTIISPHYYFFVFIVFIVFIYIYFLLQSPLPE